VWSVIEDQEFAEIAASTKEVNGFSQTLIDLAMERQSDDNLSVVTIHLHRLGPAEAAEPRRSWNPLAPLRRRVWPL
jgi:serine/threonine protein phosphatase PrpC